MSQFSRDIDLLKWEPVLFREMALPSQTLCKGEDGVTNGTSFHSDSGTFVSSGVAAGHVMTMQSSDRSIDSSYEIVSVDSETDLTVSVVRRNDEAAAAVPSGSELTYFITSYDPQSEEVAFSLLQYFGLKSSDQENQDVITFDDILDIQVLRQCSVFAILSTLFSAAACGSKDISGHWEKSLRYQKLFESARAQARVEIDTDDDNLADETRLGGAFRLRRL